MIEEAENASQTTEVSTKTQPARARPRLSFLRGFTMRRHTVSATDSRSSYDGNTTSRASLGMSEETTEEGKEEEAKQNNRRRRFSAFRRLSSTSSRRSSTSSKRSWMFTGRRSSSGGSRRGSQADRSDDSSEAGASVSSKASTSSQFKRPTRESTILARPPPVGEETEVFFWMLQRLAAHTKGTEDMWTHEEEGHKSLQEECEAVFGGSKSEAMNLFIQNIGLDHTMRQQRATINPNRRRTSASAWDGARVMFAGHHRWVKWPSMRDRELQAKEETKHVEPVGDVDDLVDAARKTLPTFKSFVAEVVSEVDGLDYDEDEMILPLKTKERALEKAKERYLARTQGPPEAWVMDMVRAQIVCDSFKQMKSVVKIMKRVARGKEGTVVRVKNDCVELNPTTFRRILINVRLRVSYVDSTAGPGMPRRYFFHTCEVQVVHRLVREYDAASDGPSIYSYFRDLFLSDARTIKTTKLVLAELAEARKSKEPLGEVVKKVAFRSGQEPGIFRKRLEIMYVIAFAKLSEYEAAVEVALQLSKMAEMVPDQNLRERELSLTEARCGEVLKKFCEEVEQNVKEHGENNLEVAESLHKLGSLYSSVGAYEEARRRFRRALRVRERLLPEASAEAVATLSALVDVAVKEGAYDDALEQNSAILQQQQNVLGEDHLDLAATYKRRGDILRRVNRNDEALDNLSRALDIQQAAVDRLDATCVSGTLNSTAITLKRLQRYDSALVRLEEGLDIYMEAFGILNRASAGILDNMGNVLENLKRYPEAMRIYGKALEVREEMFGTLHPDYAKNLSNIGAVLNKMEKYEEALSYYDRALQIVGHTHHISALILNNMAISLRRLRRYQEAINKYEQSLLSQQAIHVVPTGHAAMTLYNLAICLEKKHRYEEALERYQQSLELQRALDGPSATDADTLYNMALVKANKQEDYPGAGELMTEAYSIYCEHYGQDHDFAKDAMAWLRKWENEPGCVMS